MPSNGKITPSKFQDLCSEGRTKNDPNYILGKWPGKTALRYASEVAMGLLGVHPSEVTAPALEWGIEYEPIAIDAYEFKTMKAVIVPEHRIVHPTWEYVTGSVDGLVGANGVVEVKCPYNPLNHMLNLEYSYQLDKEYIYQTNGYLMLTGREWYDFVSYHPFFPDGLRLHVDTMERNTEITEELETKIPLFWQIVQEKYEAMLLRKG